MRITADTNVLVRAAIAAPADSEDERQGGQARAALAKAELIAVTLPSLCEFVWVLRAAYRQTPADIAAAIRRLCAAATVAVDRQAAEAGLAMLLAGGDFADGVIAHQGRLAGGETFCSFDRQALRLLAGQGHPTSDPGQAVTRPSTG